MLLFVRGDQREPRCIRLAELALLVVIWLACQPYCQLCWLAMQVQLAGMLMKLVCLVPKPD